MRRRLDGGLCFVFVHEAGLDRRKRGGVWSSGYGGDDSGEAFAGCSGPLLALRMDCAGDLGWYRNLDAHSGEATRGELEWLSRVSDVSRIG